MKNIKIYRSNYSLIIPVVITLVLTVLKLTGGINYNWFLILLPVILLVLFIIVVILMIIKSAYLFDWND